MMTKTRSCKFCNTEHPLTDEFFATFFDNNRNHLRYRCKTAQKAAGKKHYYSDRKNQIQRVVNYKSANKKKVAETQRKWYVKNIIKIKERRKLERVKEIGRKAVKKHRQKNKDNPNFIIAERLRATIRFAIKHNKGERKGSAIRDLGCSIYELRDYFAAMFTEGMNWKVFLEGKIHIDHIRPLCSFDLTDRSQFLQACHYTNLQPLWAKDNQSKGGRWLQVRSAGDSGETSELGKNGEPCDPYGSNKNTGNTVLSQADNTPDQRNAYQMNLNEDSEYNSGTSVRHLDEMKMYAELQGNEPVEL